MELIDRQALREKMYHEAFESDTDMQKWDSGCWIRYKMFENAVNDAPTIDAVPVRYGTWKVWADKHGMTQLVRIVCSECGKDMILSKENIPNYCPNCGARMDGERRDNNG